MLFTKFLIDPVTSYKQLVYFGISLERISNHLTILNILLSNILEGDGKFWFSPELSLSSQKNFVERFGHPR